MPASEAPATASATASVQFNTLESLFVFTHQYGERYPDVRRSVMNQAWAEQDAANFPEMNAKIRDYLTLLRMVVLDQNFIPRLRQNEHDIAIGVAEFPSVCQVLGTIVCRRMQLDERDVYGASGNELHDVFLLSAMAPEELWGSVLRSYQVTEDVVAMLRRSRWQLG